MRFAAALAATAVLLAGCMIGVDDELKGQVEAMAPNGSTTFECNAEKNWGSADVKALYQCFYGAPGSLEQVGNELLFSAGAAGFSVACDAGRHKYVLEGVSGDKRVSIEILERGFVTAQHVTPADVEIPAGHVLVDILVVKLDEPQPSMGERCVPDGRVSDS